ncbi:hypothetical protein [Lishizhenia sp.]|uniref:hypothetical protein n=1 Tax=Lishizhenia sp. TaxID=2497594 RepID=UPI00299EE634|nr:hypothetical protein [Lishizhenia sp.]MDX1445295.1 hypothetical protein [Lishizhenia sp.]
MQKDRGLQDRFAEFGAQPTQQVWTNLEAELTRKKKRRAALLWWTGISFGTLSILLVLLFVNTLSSTIDLKNSAVAEVEQESEVTQEKIDFSEIEENEPKSTFEKDNGAVPNKEVFDQRIATSKRTSRSNLTREEEVLIQKILAPKRTLEPDTAHIVEIVDPLLPQEDSLLRKKEEKEALVVFSNAEDSIELDSLYQNVVADSVEPVHIVEQEKELLPSKWSFGVHVGGAYDYRSVDDQVYATDASLVNNPALNNEYYVVDQVARFNNRFNVTLSARYDLTSRWRISTGLGYGQFVENVSGTEEAFNSYGIHGHTLNQNVQVNFSFLNKPKLGAYTGVAYTNSFFISPTRTGYVGSAQFQMGMSYKFSPRFSIELEPYLQYYRFGQEIEGLYGNALVGAQVGFVFRPLE